MTEPRVVDVRDGLSEEVLDGLRQATRVLVALKSPLTAVLGYWRDDELTIALIKNSHAMMIRPSAGPPIEPAPPYRPMRPVPSANVIAHGVLLDVHNAQADAFWSRVVGVLRAGDVVYVANELGRMALHIESEGSRVASLLLPKPQRVGRSAA
jgi:hypothetical protein